MPILRDGSNALFTIAQLGQTLDGRIATESGHSHYVTGETNRDHLHRLRALVDAVVVGAGTVAADDPQLTVRRVKGPNPVRVVLDPRRRLPAERQMFQDGAAHTLLMCADERGVAATHGLAEVIGVPSEDGGLDPAEILRTLHARGLRRVLVEGGGVTVSRFLAAGLLDRLHIGVAPVILGSGRPGITLPPIGTMAEALRPKVRIHPMGADTLFDCDLRTP
ncbi:RibD family protein [Ferruginivarius sediminum]|uniref:RibD family protein n=1 Tax=Ferruginivarius sediminum TaxID=2661937 RepID=UPI001F4EBE7E|nr:RibD family protein [Ferruginivarius sediminum]